MKALIQAVGGLINDLIGLVIALALLAFFWGLAKFIFHIGGDEKAVEEGKRIMKWGLIALFILVSVWGIVGFAQRELGLPDTTLPAPPEDLPNINPFDLNRNA
jgi:hypothetical protein